MQTITRPQESQGLITLADGGSFPKRGFLSGAAGERMRALQERGFKQVLKHAGISYSGGIVDDDGPRVPRVNETAPGQLDRQTGWLWDTLVVAPNTAFPAQTTMFSVPISGNTKQQAGTNLSQPGQMPFPQMMDVKSVHLFILNNSTPTDILSLYTNVWFNVVVNNNFSKLEALGWHLPAGGGLWVFGNQVGTAPSGSAVMFSASNGDPNIQNSFVLNDPIRLMAGMAFSVIVTASSPFNTQANTTNPPGTGLTLVLAFEGDRFRPMGG